MLRYLEYKDIRVGAPDVDVPDAPGRPPPLNRRKTGKPPGKAQEKETPEKAHEKQKGKVKRKRRECPREREGKAQGKEEGILKGKTRECLRERQEKPPLATSAPARRGHLTHPRTWKGE